MKLFLSAILTSLFILNPFIGIAYSCSDFSDESFKYLRNDFELCFINFDNNVEKMLLKISIDKHFEDTNSVLIIPVLSQTNEIQIKSVNIFPDICGIEFERYFDSIFFENFVYIITTQIYPFPLLIVALSENDRPSVHKTLKSNKIPDLSALLNFKVLKNDKKLINDFLSQINLNTLENFDNIMNTYKGNENSFALIWLNHKQFEKINNPKINTGILITFNTTNIFFPFKWTSFFNKSSEYYILLIFL